MITLLDDYPEHRRFGRAASVKALGSDIQKFEESSFHRQVHPCNANLAQAVFSGTIKAINQRRHAIQLRRAKFAASEELLSQAEFMKKQVSHFQVHDEDAPAAAPHPIGAGG